MKKITLLFALLIATFGWQANAQFTESFDTEIPSTWTVIADDAGSTHTWEHTTTSPHSGAGQARIHWEDDAHNDYLISPSFTVTAGTSDRVSFYAAMSGTTYTETFDVMLSTTGGNTVADFDVTLASETATSSAPNHDLFEYDLTSYVGQTVTIAIRATDTDRYYLYVDDFTVDNMPTCPKPSNIVLSNTMADGVDIAWTDNAGASAWEYVVQAAGTGVPNVAGTASATNPVTVTGLTPETDYEVYVRADCTGGDFSEWVGPENFTTLATCPAPSDVVFTNITVTSADASWTNNSSATTFEYVVQTVGDPAPTGAGTAVSAATVNLSGLAQGTSYDFYVRADCGGGDFSDWTTVENFTTLCNTIDSFPYIQNFESTPSCWEETREPSSSSYGWSTATTGHTGKGFRFNSYYNSDGNISKLHSPVFDITNLTNPQLVFYFKNPTGGDFTVSISTDGGNTYTELESGLTGQTDWLEKTYDLSTNVSSSIIIEFKGTSNYGNGDAYIYLDEVAIQMAPTCPHATDLAVSNIAGTTVDLSWTDNAGASEWEYIVQDAGTAVPTDVSTGTVVTATTANVTGLTGATDYDVYVRANCSATDHSTWYGPTSFTTDITCPAPSDISVSNITTTSASISWTDNAGASEWAYVLQLAGGTAPTGAGTVVTTTNVDVTTLTQSSSYEVFVRANCSATDSSEWTSFVFNSDCGSLTAPYAQNFDAATMPNLPVCWSKIVSSTSASAIVDTYNFLAPSPSNVVKLFPHNDATATLILISPEFSDLANQENMITFKARSLTDDTDLKIGTMSDPSDANTFVELTSISIDHNSYTTYTYSFTSYSGTDHYIALKHGNLNLKPIYIDDFSYEVDPASVQDNKIAGFNFYPNPVNNTLNLSAQDNIEKVAIYNISGQEVMTITPNALQTQVDMSRLQNGIYFVKAQINGQLTAFKVVKK